ncbi:MAG: NADH-quinone oxidoreductase subunit I [Phycisphaerales bacterium]|nr:MAG: NADH-quinone oxidoreductase subunit I [Phycisphaerales bacterium]
MKQEDIIEVGLPELSAAERTYLPQIFDGMRVTIRHMFRHKAKTVEYPEQKRTQRIENYRGLHRLNRDQRDRVACVSCFMCSTACPANCIHIEAGEAPWDDREKYPVKFEIDELRCIYCGMCEEACPVDAIELTPEYHVVGRSREEMIFDKEKLLRVYDETKNLKPRKNPKITGYAGTGNRPNNRPTAGKEPT